MKLIMIALVAALLTTLVAFPAWSHFGMVIPSDTMVMQDDSRSIRLALSFAEVEVEYYNQNKKYTAPTEYMITQALKADANGVFTYAAPVSGWWGFAALNRANHKLPHQGEEKEVELGAVIWVYFHKMQ